MNREDVIYEVRQVAARCTGVAQTALTEAANLLERRVVDRRVRRPGPLPLAYVDETGVTYVVDDYYCTNGLVWLKALGNDLVPIDHVRFVCRRKGDRRGR